MLSSETELFLTFWIASWSVELPTGLQASVTQPAELIVESAGLVVVGIERGDGVGGIVGDHDVGQHEPSAGLKRQLWADQAFQKHCELRTKEDAH